MAFSVCTAIFLGLLASARTTNRIYRETDVSLPPEWQWQRSGRARAEERIEIIIAVKQTNKDLLEQTVLVVSDPDSSAYGLHLTLEQVNELVSPTSESVAAVRAHLDAHGVNACESTSHHDFIKCYTTVAAAEALLGATYHYYSHHKANVTVLRTPYYSLPEELSKHVDFVSPTVRFPTPQARVRRTAGKKSDHDNTPDGLRKMYKIGKVEGAHGKQSCTAFLEEYYSQDDLDQFWKFYYPNAEGQKINVVGPNEEGKPGAEASLDIEYMTAIGGGIETEFWSFAGRAPDNPENEPFLKWIYLVGNTSDSAVPKVFSTSYGEPENTVSMDYMARINVEFQKAAARGISLMFATGDNGVADDDGMCPNSRFQGQWPAGSPWVTSVGGTDGDPEQAWSGSAGGFSDVWARPTYQTEAVANYFNTIKSRFLPDAKYFNQTGAGFPDVSAQATNFQIIQDKVSYPVDGTSCACPTFSGVVSLLNDVRLAAGKPTLGFLNPLFYKNAPAFMDITHGSNEVGENCGPKGFSASKGWDPVTGLGTPDYKKLSEIVSKLP